MEAQKLTKIVKIVTSVATAFVVLLVGIIVAEYIKINSLNREIDDITSNLENLSKTESAIEKDTSYHSSSIYIEDYARRELRMLENGENYIIFE